jgi:dolichol-phosphate mannosyltransferase
LYERLVACLPQVEWEWIVVDDHSCDDTFAVLRSLAARDSRVRGFRLATNSGSHVAISCGLSLARGAAAALVVADLQDPPELLVGMIARWRRGMPVVWAMRRREVGTRDSWFPALYYWIVRRVVGLTAMPRGGVDFFLIDRDVIDAFLARVGSRVSVFVLLMRLGFPQEFVEYDKQARAGGRGGWTLSRKLQLVFDSVVCGSDFPLWRALAPKRGLPSYALESETNATV